MVYVYVLKLTHDKYYVGKTENPKMRLENHFNGHGCDWTKLYRPIKMYKLIPDCDKDDENKWTIIMMREYGIDNVRGGAFCQKKLSNSTKEAIKKLIDSSDDSCYKCGGKHFSKFCKPFIDTQMGYKDGTKYTIEEIIENNIKDVTTKEGCKLILCKGSKIKPYLRKYTNNEMTEWHKEWQSYFEDYTEKSYNCNGKLRRTDVDLNDTEIIEFQYSKMSSAESKERLRDWGIKNKKIIWVICGDNTIDVTQINDRYILEFVREPWKYKSFLNNDEIFINIKNKIFRINPNEVKSRFIEVQHYLDKKEFIDNLKKSIPWKKEIIQQTKIFIKQQGAGNGKTYGIIQLLEDKDFQHYDTFIYITKQHSAKHIIKSEIEDQIKRNVLNIKIIDHKEPSRKHIITFNENKKIIIGTFDSFVYALGNKNVEGTNKFLRMVNSIIDEELKCSEEGNVKYADGNIRLCKRMLLIGDEMQDLHEDYMKAVIKITRERYVDFYAVGDKLQSISIEKNAFTFLDKELPKVIEKIQFPPSNICRRFINTGIIKFINFMVPFEKYSLPCIEPYKDDDTNNKSLHFIEEDRNIDYDKQAIKIMNDYKNEVEENNRKPNDFLIVTPFVNKNPLVDFFNDRIRKFWKTKENKDKYEKYSVFHKSEEGSSIDLSESDNATRIVSIHSSKGDGRPVVFVIGINSSSLVKFSDVEDSLVFNSLLHVALTRCKETLYFRYSPNYDCLHRKILEYQNIQGECNIKPIIDITKSIQMDKISDYITKHNEDIIKEIFIDKSVIPELPTNENSKEIIDMKHHYVRYFSFFIILSLEIYNKTKDKKQPIYQILNQLVGVCVIKNYDKLSKYHKILVQDGYKDIIPIFKRTKGDYSRYFDEIWETHKNIIIQIKNSLENKKDIELEYNEVLVLYHLITIKEQRKFTNFPINDLYDIIDYKNNIEDENIYINSHYKKMEKIKIIFKNLPYENMKYLYFHYVEYSPYEEYKIWKKFDIIAFNEDCVLLCYIKPQFSSLNKYDVFKQSVFDSFLIKNSKQEKNVERFKNKKIKICVFTLDNDDKPFIYEWVNNNCPLVETNEGIIKNILKEEIIKYFEKHNESVYWFYKYWYEQYKHFENPENIVEEIISKLQSERKYSKFPRYIKKMFDRLDDDDDLLEKYTEQEYFMKKINKILEKDIGRFLK